MNFESNTQLKWHSLGLGYASFEAGARAVKTPGGGFVLTRFLLPFHRMEKEEPVRLEYKKDDQSQYIILLSPQKIELIRKTTAGNITTTIKAMSKIKRKIVI